MNFVYQYLPEEIINAIGWTIFHSIWQGALIAVILGVVLFLASSRSANWRYAVSIIALVIFSLTATITFIQKYEPALEDKISSRVIPQKTVQVSEVYFENPIEQPTKTPGIIEQLKNYFRQNLSLFVLAWFLGFLFFLLRFAGTVLHLQRIRSYGLKELDVEWLYRSRQLSQKLGIDKFVYVYESARVKIPIALGYLKPIILLPIGMINGLPYTQVEALIAHELSHIKRYDFLVNLLQSFIETIFFYHPAIWWISNQIKEERENCCDDLTISICGDSLAYSKALYNLQHIKGNHPELALAARGKVNQLLRRIKRMNGEKSKLSYGGRFAALMFLFVFMGALFLFSSSTATENKKVNTISFLNAASIDGNNSSVKPPVFTYGHRDTSSIKKGKHTFKFNKEVNGEEKCFKAKLNNGKLEKLYVDGDEVPAGELNKYENQVAKQLDEYDSAMKEYRESLDEYRNTMRKQNEKLRELRKKLKYPVNHYSGDWNSEFPEDFSVPGFDREEFKKMMKDVKENIHKNFANRSFTIPEIHIPPINVPPIPPINYGINGGDDDYFDKAEFKKEMKEWSKEFNENMKELKENLQNQKIDLGNLSEEINKSVNSPEFKKSMEELKENMGKLKIDLKHLKEFMRNVKDELITDRLINEEDDLDGFYLTTKEMKINGEKVSDDLHKKYLSLYKKHYGKELRDDQKFNIND